MIISEDENKNLLKEQQDLTKLKKDLYIAIKGSAADERRRSTVIPSTKTLDDLTEALKSHGYNLSHSSVYLHLRPRNKASHEGKIHVKKVEK